VMLKVTIWSRVRLVRRRRAKRGLAGCLWRTQRIKMMSELTRHTLGRDRLSRTEKTSASSRPSSTASTAMGEGDSRKIVLTRQRERRSRLT
jgi:hypothetical protein